MSHTGVLEHVVMTLVEPSNKHIKNMHKIQRKSCICQ